MAAPRPPPFSMQSEDVDRFKHRLLRTKTIQSQTSLDKDDLGGGENPENPTSMKKVLSTFDLTSLGVGSCCGTGMYVVAGMVAKNVAGPSTILSFCIAAIASILSGVCYGEFGVRVPKTCGSAYMYSYVSVGEFVAFLIGWNLILEYMIGSAAGASAISACFDALGNHSMSRYLQDNIGTVIGSSHPDLLGCAIAIAMTAVLALGVRNSMRMNHLLNGVNLVVFIFILIAGLTHADISNWSPFAPQGASGIFSGAATCFYAFIGFDIIATAGEEAQQASRSIPRAIVVSLVICLVAYASVTAVLTLMLPVAQIHAGSALVDAFAQVGLPAGKYLVAIGAVAALTVSLLGSMFPMPRVIYAMARDGLLFNFLAEIHPKTGTPLMATVITGLMSAALSLMVSLDILVEMMSIGTLLAYTLVSLSVLMLRYQPHTLDTQSIALTPALASIQESPTHENTTAGDTDRDPLASNGAQQNYGSVPAPTLRQKADRLRQNLCVVWLELVGSPSADDIPCNASAKSATVYIGALVAVQTTTCMLIVFGHAHLARGDALSIICLLLLLGGVGFCMAMLIRQPQNKKKLAFMVPAVPFLPCVAVFFNTYLMLKLPGLTWARLAVWIVLGMILYFTYGMFHSVKERKQREKQLSDRHEKDLAGKAKTIMENGPQDFQDVISNTDAHSCKTTETHDHPDGYPTYENTQGDDANDDYNQFSSPYHSASKSLHNEQSRDRAERCESSLYDQTARRMTDEGDPYAADERASGEARTDAPQARPRPRPRPAGQTRGLLPAP